MCSSDLAAGSSVASPLHAYASPGTYTVTLVAVQGSCSDTLTRINYITVQPGPIADFTTGNNCFGDSVRFTNRSLANGSTITGYSWDFGDASATSSSSNPVHYYAQPGTYQVTLVVHSSGVCQDTLVQSVNVLPRPVISFSTNNVSGCDSLTVFFTNTSTDATSYQIGRAHV